MRFSVLACVAVLLAVPIAVSQGTNPALRLAVHLDGACPGAVAPFTCAFDAEAQDPTLIFYRFDFLNTARALAADGVWDYPEQTGAPQLGKWTTQGSVTWSFFENSTGRACVQVWDGVSTRIVNGQTLPAAPIGCSAFLSVAPDHWRGNGSPPARWVLARLDAPSWLAPADFNPRNAELEGVRARWLATPGSAGVFLFLVDRAALTAKLGVGTHVVHLTLVWAGTTFTGATTIRIE